MNYNITQETDKGMFNKKIILIEYVFWQISRYLQMTCVNLAKKLFVLGL